VKDERAANLGAGRRYDPAGDLRVLCTSCSCWKAGDKFSAVSGSPHNRTCKQCEVEQTEERQTISMFRTNDRQAMSAAVWAGYLKPIAVENSPGKSMMYLRDAAVDLLMADAPVPERYETAIIRALRDKKMATRVAIWLAFKDGLLDDDVLRMLATDFAERAIFATGMADDEDMMRLASTVVGRVRTSVIDPGSPVAQAEGKKETRRIASTIAPRLIGNVPDDDLVWDSVHAVIAMTDADTSIAVINAAVKMVDATRRGLRMRQDTALKSVASAVQDRVYAAYDDAGRRVLTKFQEARREDEDRQRKNRVMHRTGSLEVDIPKRRRGQYDGEGGLLGVNDPLLKSYWVEQSRMDFPRYFQVVNSSGNFVLLKCVGCPSDPKEDGTEQEVERAVLEFSGEYVRVFENDIEADGVEVKT
jgi:hypothetical protein